MVGRQEGGGRGALSLPLVPVRERGVGENGKPSHFKRTSPLTVFGEGVGGRQERAQHTVPLRKPEEGGAPPGRNENHRRIAGKRCDRRVTRRGAGGGQTRRSAPTGTPVVVARPGRRAGHERVPSLPMVAVATRGVGHSMLCPYENRRGRGGRERSTRGGLPETAALSLPLLPCREGGVGVVRRITIQWIFPSPAPAGEGVGGEGSCPFYPGPPLPAGSGGRKIKRG